jgi:putative membrane-bound dehydrogenase-like protein
MKPRRRLFRAALAASGCLLASGATAFAAAPDNAEPKRAQFKFASQTLSVPEGFTVELVAGPPIVNRPISMAFDEHGRLYVTDSSGLSDKAEKQFELKPHRIVRLEDADNDGRFERSVVFAENMMFPQGALFHEGSLYTAAPPHIWKLTDTNGDGVADDRVIWYDGKTLTGCANDVHGPYLGPDGWFYWTKGAFAEQRHTLGNGKPFITKAAHIFRARPDGAGLEPVLTGGMDNPVGVTFSSTGDRFLSGTFFQIGVAGKRDGLIHAIYGGVYGKENAAAAGHPRTGDLMPIMTHSGASAPCGSTTYRSSGFGADYTDNLFVCYFNLRKISRHTLTTDGATFSTQDTDFVTSDSQDFRPTDVLEDADGSLLIVDTGGWYKICCPTSQLAKPDVLGGIYRIRKTGAERRNDPRGMALRWPEATDAELVDRLGDDRSYVQERAIHTLGGRGVHAVPAIVELALQNPSTVVRRNAVWALARIDGEASRTAVRKTLADSDTTVAQAALHVTSLWRDRPPIDRLVRFLQGNNPSLARAAAEALGRTGDFKAVDVLLAAAARLDTNATDALGVRVLEHSIIYALIEIAQREPLLARLNRTEHPRVVRVALLALDQMEGGGGLKPADVLAWLDSPVPLLKQTAGWIVARHSDWGDALAGFFREQLAASKTRNEVERTELQTQLAQLAKAPAIQELLSATATDSSADQNTRLLVLRAMSASGLRETPVMWLSTLAALLPADVALTRQAVATARVLPLPRAGHVELSTALARVGRDTRLPVDVRLDALAATSASALGPMEPDLFEFLCAYLAPKEPLLVRGAAATALAKAPLSPSQQLALADALQTISPLEVSKLLPAFERAPDETLGLRLIAALNRSPGLAGLRPSTLNTLFAKYPQSVQQRAETMLARFNADAVTQNAQVDAALAGIKSGDVRRGQVVFNSEKSACTLCHVIGYQGGRLGPDLTNIGRIRNERELLEAVMFPSATFVRGYEPVVVTSKSGDAHSGIVRTDAADEVVLATGPEMEQPIARSNIADISPSPISPMPPGMNVLLTKQELSDLVAFLKSRQ